MVDDRQIVSLLCSRCSLGDAVQVVAQHVGGEKLNKSLQSQSRFEVCWHALVHSYIRHLSN